MTTATSSIDPARFGLSRLPIKLIVGLASVAFLFTPEPANSIGALGLIATVFVRSRKKAVQRELTKRIGQFREAMKSGGSGREEVNRILAVRDQLNLIPEDVPLESEALEGLLDVADIEERGTLTAIAGHERVLADEPCYFVAAARLDKRGPDEDGQVFVTGTRFVFLGATLTEIPFKKIATCEVVLAERGVRVQRNDRQTPLVFRFGSMSEAMRANAIATLTMAKGEVAI